MKKQTYEKKLKIQYFDWANLTDHASEVNQELSKIHAGSTIMQNVFQFGDKKL